MNLWLTPHAREDLDYWRQSQPAIAGRVEKLLDRLAAGEKLPDLAHTRLEFGLVSLMSFKIAPETLILQNCRSKCYPKRSFCETVAQKFTQKFISPNYRSKAYPKRKTLRNCR
jgi:hypothetical protein